MCIDTAWYNNFLDSSSDGQKISSQRSWWLSTGQHRKAAEHPFPHDLLLPAFDVETLVIYKARACVCHLLNKVNAHAKSDWIAFCELHILAKSTSGDPANWTSSTWKLWKGDSTGIIWNTLRSLYDHQINQKESYLVIPEVKGNKSTILTRRLRCCEVNVTKIWISNATCFTLVVKLVIPTSIYWTQENFGTCQLNSSQPCGLWYSELHDPK